MAGSWNDEDRLAIRALREGWKIPPDRMKSVIDRALQIATGPEDGPAVKAINALINAGKLQLATIDREMKLEEHMDLIERMKRMEGDGGERGAEGTG
jgi:hypothetical protein